MKGALFAQGRYGFALNVSKLSQKHTHSHTHSHILIINKRKINKGQMGVRGVGLGELGE